MERQISLGKQIKKARQEQQLTQLEFANRCNLNIRTIQRIENDEVTARPYTLRIISDVLGVPFLRKDNDEDENEQIEKLRDVFEKRKQIRVFTFIVAIFLLASALVFIFSGIPKLIWAPFIYFFFFADLLVIGLTWRCLLDLLSQ